MTAFEAIGAIERLGGEVYVRPDGELLLRSATAGKPIKTLAVQIAIDEREKIVALGTEYAVRGSKVEIVKRDGELIMQRRQP